LVTGERIIQDFNNFNKKQYGAARNTLSDKMLKIFEKSHVVVSISSLVKV